MINHFGRKPVRGGRPAKESRVSIKVALRDGFFVQEVIIVDNLMVLDELKVRNTVEVRRV